MTIIIILGTLCLNLGKINFLNNIISQEKNVNFENY